MLPLLVTFAQSRRLRILAAASLGLGMLVVVQGQAVLGLAAIAIAGAAAISAGHAVGQAEVLRFLRHGGASGGSPLGHEAGLDAAAGRRGHQLQRGFELEVVGIAAKVVRPGPLELGGSCRSGRRRAVPAAVRVDHGGGGLGVHGAHAVIVDAAVLLPAAIVAVAALAAAAAHRVGVAAAAAAAALEPGPLSGLKMAVVA